MNKLRSFPELFKLLASGSARSAKINYVSSIVLKKAGGMRGAIELAKTRITVNRRNGNL